MADIAALTKLIEPEAKALGLALVRVAMFGGRSDPTLQVMAERPDTRQLDLSDCEALSRLSARGQLARHRSPADTAAGLCRLDRFRCAGEARRADFGPQAV